MRRKILVICPFPVGVAAAQRLKYEQYFDDWEQAGWDITVSCFMDTYMWSIVYERGHHIPKILGVLRGYKTRFINMFSIKNYDLIYIHMWVTPFGGSFFESITRVLAKKIIYDIEDNILVLMKSDVNPFIKYLRSNRKILYLIRFADHVITSSPFLNQYCFPINKKHSCTYISSSVDTDCFIPVNKYNNDHKIVIGWTGTFSSKLYLDLLRSVFIELNKRCHFQLRVIGNFSYEFPEIDLEVIQWTKENEVIDLQGIDIGVYPLANEEWVQGKSGLKAIQYMAFGLPTVATAIGNTINVIDNMVNGWLVSSDAEWVDALEKLVCDASLRRSMGEAARKKAVDNYSTNVIKTMYKSILSNELRSLQ